MAINNSPDGSQGFLIGYLMLAEVAQNRFRGAYMIVDEVGVPKEAWFSDPIDVTRVQRILYGASLRAHLARDHCRKALLQSCKQRPCCIIADGPEFLELHTSDLPVLYIEKSPPIHADLSSAGMGEDEGASDVQPVIEHLNTSKGAHEDYDSVLPLVRGLYTALDVVEPFERLRIAVGEVERAAQETARKKQ